MSLAKELLEGIVDPSPFLGTEFPYPVNQSLFGGFDLENLRYWAERIDETRVVDHLDSILALAEAAEASQPDKKELFIVDRVVRARLVGLNSATGWALLWGKNDERSAKLAELLQGEGFQVFVVAPQEPQGLSPSFTSSHVYLGSRPTSAIYFLQAILRYPHIYGRIPLGDNHEAVHFIEDHAPGVVLLPQDGLAPLEEAMLLGIMSQGVPAVVPSTFDSPYGNTRRADDPQEMVAQALSFPNLRVRKKIRFDLDLPVNLDPAFASEEIQGGCSFGGTALSSFVVTDEDKGDGVEVVGEMGPDVGIEIAAGDPKVDITMTEYL